LVQYDHNGQVLIGRLLLAKNRGYGGGGMTIRKVVQVSINPGMAAEFQAAASKFIQRVESQEPNTLSYEWFLDEDHETCYILESYRDDDALLYHLENIRDLYEQLFTVCELTRLQVFGKVSEEVRAAHMSQTQFYDLWAGVARAFPGVK
jgi:quinol monooxygenase YgiN